MPTSSREGKDWLIPRILAEKPERVLDIGAGAGLYATLLREAGLPASCELIAIEAHEPYVHDFGLENLYDRVIVADVRTRRKLPTADVVILGDVIEHMDTDDAVRVWEKCRKVARRTLLASIPLGEFPQGAVGGNELERHVSTWTNEKVHQALPGVVASWTGSEIGTYAALPLGVTAG